MNTGQLGDAFKENFEKNMLLVRVCLDQESLRASLRLNVANPHMQLLLVKWVTDGTQDEELLTKDPFSRLLGLKLLLNSHKEACDSRHKFFLEYCSKEMMNLEWSEELQYHL